MGLKEAKEYIENLHRLQDDPKKWPDYLTGLHDRSAVARMVDEIYPKLGKYSISLVKIANVQPYLLKYGSSRHADIIQWAAAILKTTASQYKGTFVGAAGTHEFAVICRAGHAKPLLKKAAELFLKKTRDFYTKSDLDNEYILTFEREGKTVKIGLMNLAHVTLDGSEGIEKSEIIPHLLKLSSARENPLD